MKNKNIQLSQCMIVKNEEENIVKALSWGKGIVCEQIVVDTGSTDRTVELAQSLGAKVYHFPWIDDFSAAKNYAIEQATGDWIAFLDADEYIKEEDIENILPMLQQAEDSGLYAVRTDMFSVDQEEMILNMIKHTRFFRRMPELRYVGIVHEYLSLLDGRDLDQYLMDTTEIVVIYHTGYAPGVMEKKKKYERNLRLLLKNLEAHPEDYYTMGDLGDHYLVQDGQEAERWYRKAVRRIPRTPAAQCDRNIKTFLNLMMLVWKKEDETELRKLYKEITGRFPDVFDADYMMGRFYTEVRKDYRKGAFHLERALQLLEQRGIATYGLMLVKDLPVAWELLAKCCYENKNLKSCVTYCVGLLQADRKRLTALELLLQAFAAERPQSVVQFLSRLYQFNAVEDRNLIMQACRNVGATEVLKVFYDCV